MTDMKSPWYPYPMVQDSYIHLEGIEEMPKKICDYLLDAPKGLYAPIDDNRYPRCRLWKYLFYDLQTPLSKPLPTIQEKMSVLFNPEKPTDPPTEKGYRLYPLVWTKEAQESAQTRINVFMGRMVPSNENFKAAYSVVFDIFTHYTYETNTKTDAYSRALAIEQSLVEALNGVCMDGIGTFFLSRTKHPDCGSRVFYDGKQNVGRELTMAFEVATSATQSMGSPEIMSFFSPDGKIRM